MFEKINKKGTQAQDNTRIYSGSDYNLIYYLSFSLKFYKQSTKTSYLIK